MFKEKLYSGTFIKSSTTKTITRIPETTTLTCNIEKANILCNALLDFLTECGCEVSYEDESLVIYICGIPLVFHFTSSNLYYSNIYAGSCTVVTGGTSSTNIFNNDGTYNFKLALIGEPTGFFGLFISNYSLLYNNANYIYFVNLENILENEPYSGIYGGNNPLSFFVFKRNPCINISNAVISFSKTSYSMNDKEKLLTGNQGKYPLIPYFVGPYKLKNCYYFMKTNEISSNSTPGPTGGTFYKIDGKIYMANGSTWLTECVF